MAKYSFANLTGCTSYDSVVHAINLFKHFTGINEIFNLKIFLLSTLTKLFFEESYLLK